jgi:hypothetical protein
MAECVLLSIRFWNCIWSPMSVHTGTTTTYPAIAFATGAELFTSKVTASGGNVGPSVFPGVFNHDYKKKSSTYCNR